MAKAKNEAQLLNLLKSVLPRAVPDAKLAQSIYAALEKDGLQQVQQLRFVLCFGHK